MSMDPDPNPIRRCPNQLCANAFVDFSDSVGENDKIMAKMSHDFHSSAAELVEDCFTTDFACEITTLHIYYSTVLLK